MRLNLAALLTITLALPVSVEVPNGDSTRAGGETRIGVSGSVGRYALVDRGCEGQVIDTHPRDFAEAGLEAVHQFESGLSVGVRAGAIHENVEDPVTIERFIGDTIVVQRYEWDNTYVNPSIAYEGGVAGIGAGVVVARRPFVTNEANDQRILPSLHLRLGRLDGQYLRLAFMESVPLYAGGGYVDLGIGSHLNRRWDVYAGVSGLPFDGPGITLRTECRLHPHLALTAGTRLGAGGGESQHGAALGLRYVSRSPVPRRITEAPREYRSRMWKPESDTLRSDAVARHEWCAGSEDG